MNRFVTFRNNAAIVEAHSIVPQGILNRLHFDYFVGCDPIYAGLANIEDTNDGRSYRNTAHVAYPWHQSLSVSLRKTTIVIPQLILPFQVIHEIGHVLDEYLGFMHVAIPVTEYANRDRFESFAEAFTAWLFYDYATAPCKTTTEIDEGTSTLFESLKN